MSGLTGSPITRPAEWLASLTGDFYFRAFNGLVTLPVAGYDYGGNWTISSTASFAAQRTRTLTCQSSRDQPPLPPVAVLPGARAFRRNNHRHGRPSGSGGAP